MKLPRSVAILLIVACTAPVSAQPVFNWTGGSTTSSDWSDPANWQGGGVPAGLITSVITFNAAPRPTNTNDLPNPPLVLNQLNFGNGASALTTIGGGGFDFQGAAPTITSALRAATINGGVNFSVTTTVSGSGNSPITLAGGLTGAGGLTVSGSTVVLTATGGPVNYAGPTAVTSGTLQVDGSLTMSTSTITLSGGGSGFLGGAGTVNRPVQCTFGTLFSTASNTFTVNGGVGNLTGGGTTAAVTINAGANSNLVVNGNTNVTGGGSDMFIRTGATYGGTGTITVGDGNPNVSRPDLFMEPGATIGAGQTVTVTGYTTAVGGGYVPPINAGSGSGTRTVNGPVNLHNAALIGPTTGGALTFNGPVRVFADSLPNSDDGTLVGALAFTNTLTVDAGARLNTTAALTMTGPLINNGTILGSGGSLTIGPGGTLRGSGTVGGPTMINSGGKLSPGNSPGSLTVAGTLTLSGEYDWELNGNTTAGPGTNYDQLVASGTTSTLGPTSSLAVGLLSGVDLTDPFWAGPHSWTVWNQTSGTLSGAIGSVTNGTYPEGSFSTSTQANAVELTWTPVPEPSTILVTALAAAALAIRRLQRPSRRWTLPR